MCEPSTGKPSEGGHPVGESQNQPFQLSFNRFLRVDFQGSRITSDGGLLFVRELDERLDLTGLIQNHLVDSRTGRNTQFPLADLFRQSANSRLAGYDPSRGLAVSRVHVAVAAGFDHDLACPVAGLYRGGSRSQMEASLRMHVDPDRSIS